MHLFDSVTVFIQSYRHLSCSAPERKQKQIQVSPPMFAYCCHLFLPPSPQKNKWTNKQKQQQQQQQTLCFRHVKICIFSKGGWENLPSLWESKPCCPAIRCCITVLSCKPDFAWMGFYCKFKIWNVIFSYQGKFSGVTLEMWKCSCNWDFADKGKASLVMRDHKRINATWVKRTAGFPIKLTDFVRLNLWTERSVAVKGASNWTA